MPGFQNKVAFWQKKCSFFFAMANSWMSAYNEKLQSKPEAFNWKSHCRSFQTEKENENCSLQMEFAVQFSSIQGRMLCQILV